jgi:hypothetical protein
MRARPRRSAQRWAWEGREFVVVLPMLSARPAEIAQPAGAQFAPKGQAFCGGRQP